MQPKLLLAGGAVLIAIVIGFAAMTGVPTAPAYDRLYVVSTIDALMQGVYDGTVTVEALEREGDTGVGTFDRLDGELVMLDGVVYQALATGEMVPAPSNETTPFASVSWFRADRTTPLGPVQNFSILEQRLDGLLTTPNLFTMVRVDGTFDYVKVRAPPAQEKPYPRLVDALAKQHVSELRHVQGTVVGTYSPPYTAGVAIPGWHLHFISTDRRRGGHILEITTRAETTASLDELSSFTVQIPVGTDFTRTNLSQNLSSDLRIVEKGR